MLTKQKLSSVQLLVTLFLCGTPVIVLQNFYADSKCSFIHTLIAAVIAAVLVFVFMLPAIIIKNKTDSDFICIAKQRTPNLIIFISAVYCLYFVYGATYFLSSYIDMMTEKINPDANSYVLAFILLAACVYGAYKGVNAITRCAIFLFAFSVLSFVLIFSGNISNLDFSNTVFYEESNFADCFDLVSYFSILGAVSVIFACTAGKTKNFRIRQPLLLVFSFILIIAVSQFFVYFVLGEFGKAQAFQFFTLSKTGKIGTMRGLDSLFLALSVSAVFVLVSMLIVCMNRSAERSSSIKMSVIFGAVIFTLFLCVQSNDFCKSILNNQYIFLGFTVICALVVPSLYFLIGRNRNEKITLYDITGGDTV